MKRALAIVKREKFKQGVFLPPAKFLTVDDGTSTDANHAHKFFNLDEVSTRLHEIYTRHAADLSYTQLPVYGVVELVYARVQQPECDEVLDHTELVWRYTDGREFPVGENRRRCVLVRPKQSWSWRLAR